MDPISDDVDDKDVDPMYPIYVRCRRYPISLCEVGHVIEDMVRD
jgi:hypothetical protein